MNLKANEFVVIFCSYRLIAFWSRFVYAASIIFLALRILKLWDLTVQLLGSMSLDRVLKIPESKCHISGFGDSTVNLELRVWIIDPKKRDLVSVSLKHIFLTRPRPP